MTPQLLHFGESRTPVIVIDGFSGRLEAIVSLAKALAPFAPETTTYYPGLRRIITPADTGAYAYAEDLLEKAAPFLGGTWDIDAFEWVEASFSMVTRPPDQLGPAQRAPHIDTAETKYLALLHYLSDTPGSGTAFYRHRATGVEAATADILERFLLVAESEALLGMPKGYVSGSNRFYEEIGFVESKPDRLVIYPGNLLHSGRIPDNMIFSDDPAKGRLTANLFIRGH